MTASLVPGRRVLFGQLGLIGCLLAVAFLRYFAGAGPATSDTSPTTGQHPATETVADQPTP